MDHSRLDGQRKPIQRSEHEAKMRSHELCKEDSGAASQ